MAMAGLQLAGVPQAQDFTWWAIFLAFSSGVAAIAFAPGRRWSVVALLYYLSLYFVFDANGMFAKSWY
jgi:hypothetical protein